MDDRGANVAAEETRHQREVHYSGRVQGVGFRYTVRSLAGRFQVTGFVRNLSDGRVHLVVEGPRSEVEEFLGEIRAEMSYYIGSVQETERAPTGRFPSFEIRH
jgi:acylphosphatase